MQDFFDQIFWNNTLRSYLQFILTIITGFVVLYIARHIVLRRLLKRSARTWSMVDNEHIKSIGRYILPMLYTGVFYLATAFLSFSPTLARIINILLIALFIFFGAVLLSILSIGLFNRYWKIKRGGTDVMAARWIAVMLRILIWVCALLLFLENIGVEVTALIAGLGIGGIAIAFAAQAVLEDVFSFITIFFDRPFEIGDFIIVDTLSGTVEHIGVKTTRVRSLSGEQLVFSNRDLTSSRLHNYKRMASRRAVFKIGVTYDTTAEKLREIPGLIKDLFEGIESVEFGRAHFSSFGDFSLNFEIVYFVTSQDYVLFMDIQQELNLRIKAAFDSQGITFAFPTQTLHVKNEH